MRAQVSADSDVTPLVNGVQPRVILVDVNDESRDVMTRRLAAQGYRVDATGDPAAGADMALSSPPDLLIADRQVVVQLHARRFRCREKTCSRRTFAEQEPLLVDR